MKNTLTPELPAIPPLGGRWCVYAPTCNGEIRYIGITLQSLSRRLSQHLSDAKRPCRKEHKTNWIRKCLADGLRVEIKPLRKWMEENDACRIERQIIAKLRPQIVNIHEGGASGYSGLPPEAKDRHRESMNRLNETPQRIEWAKRQSKLMHAAKARKRISEPAPDYPAIADFEKPVKRITIENLLDGTTNKIVLFPSRKRSDMFRAEVNGVPWRDAIGYSAIMASLRKAR